MKLINVVNDFYNIVDQNEKDKLKAFDDGKTLLLYPMTIMDDNLLNILTGIATALSINILTGLLLFEESSFCELVLWLIRFVSALVFNYGVIKLTVICALLRNKAADEAENVKIPGERKSAYRNALIRYYDERYREIKIGVITIVVALIFLFALIIIWPIIHLIFINCGCSLG